MSRAIARVLRADLVVVDDIGLLPVAADAADAVVEDRLERARLIALGVEDGVGGVELLLFGQGGAGHAFRNQAGGDQYQGGQSQDDKGINEYADDGQRTLVLHPLHPQEGDPA